MLYFETTLSNFALSRFTILDTLSTPNKTSFIPRLGKLLAEGNPLNLLNEYNESNLEDLFLKLSKKDDNLESITEASYVDDHNVEMRNMSDVSNKNLVVVNKCATNKDKWVSSRNKKENTDVSAFKKIGACMMKTFNRMKKRHAFYFEFVLPIIQVKIYFE